MAKSEFTSRNGTLSISEQTNKQREMFKSRFSLGDKVFGVGKSNEEKLFPSSPIGYNNEIPDSRIDVYQEYKDVIDIPEKSGFGFSGTDTAYMNYNHPDNPFVVDDSVDYEFLTSGSAHEDEDRPRKAYRGFPDLDVSSIDINAPADPAVQDKLPTSGLNLTPDGATYGHDTESYRTQIFDSLGKHVESGKGNGDIETLGKFFTKVVDE